MEGNHSSHHFLTSRALGGRSQLNSILSTEIACRLRDVGWDPSQGTPCAAPSVRYASHLPIRQRGSSRCPASGQLEEVMWGCRRRLAEEGV